MALSDHEQRLLDQLEAQLAAEDPRLAHLLRGTVPRRHAQTRRAALACLGLLAGLVGLVGGMQIHPIVSVLGFVVMLISAVSGLGIWTQAIDEERQAARAMHPSNALNRQAARSDEQGREPYRF